MRLLVAVFGYCDRLACSIKLHVNANYSPHFVSAIFALQVPFRPVLPPWAVHDIANATFPADGPGQKSVRAEPGLWDPGGIISNTCAEYEQPVCSASTKHEPGLWEPGGDLSQTYSAAAQPFVALMSALLRHPWCSYAPRSQSTRWPMLMDQLCSLWQYRRSTLSECF